MDAVNMVCEYLYDTFKTILKKIESIEETVKGMIKKILSFANSIYNMVEKQFYKVFNKIEYAIKLYNKTISNLVINIDTPDISAICQDFFKCWALLKELLEDTPLNRHIKKKLKNTCQTVKVKSLLDRMDDLINNFKLFQEFICNFGLSFDFAIDGFKFSLTSYKKQLVKWAEWLEKKKKMLDGKVQLTFDTMIHLHLPDFLDKLLAFFECIFDVDIDLDLDFDFDLEDLNPCAAIATAQNLFDDALATMHIVHEGDGYCFDKAWKKQVFSPIDAAIEKLMDLKEKCELIESLVINPVEVKVSIGAQHDSQYVLVGSMKLSDLKPGKWKKQKIIKLFDTTKDSIVSAFIQKKTGTSNATTNSSSKTYVTSVSKSVNEESYTKTGAIQKTTISSIDGNSVKTNSSKFDAIDPGRSIDSVIMTNNLVNKDKISGPSINNQKNTPNIVNSNEYGKKGINNASISPSINSNVKGKKLGMLLANLNKTLNTDKYTTEYIINNTEISNDGRVIIKDGCDSIELDNLPLLSSPIMYEFYASKALENVDTILDGEELINQNEAAVKIACDPTSDLAVRSFQIYSAITLDSAVMPSSDNLAIKY